jgi:hypothetical protein
MKGNKRWGIRELNPDFILGRDKSCVGPTAFWKFTKNVLPSFSRLLFLSSQIPLHKYQFIKLLLMLINPK